MSAPVRTEPELAEVVGALRDEYEVIDGYLAALHPERWHGPTACSDWRITNLVSHLGSGAEIHLLTMREYVDAGEPVTQEIRQGIWGHFDSLAPEPLHAAFRDRNQRYLDYAAQLSPEQQQRRVKMFAGELPPANYAQFRLQEVTLHSWDLRVALDPTARLLPRSVRVNFRLMRGNLARRANADARAALNGTVYAIDVYGPVVESFGLRVNADAVELLDTAPTDARARLRLPAEAYLRLGSGRLPLEQAEAAGDVAIEGDRALGLRLNALYPGF